MQELIDVLVLKSRDNWTYELERNICTLLCNDTCADDITGLAWYMHMVVWVPPALSPPITILAGSMFSLDAFSEMYLTAA